MCKVILQLIFKKVLFHARFLVFIGKITNRIFKLTYISQCRLNMNTATGVFTFLFNMLKVAVCAKLTVSKFKMATITLTTSALLAPRLMASLRTARSTTKNIYSHHKDHFWQSKLTSDLPEMTKNHVYV